MENSHEEVIFLWTRAQISSKVRAVALRWTAEAEGEWCLLAGSLLAGVWAVASLVCVDSAFSELSGSRKTQAEKGEKGKKMRKNCEELASPLLISK